MGEPDWSKIKPENLPEYKKIEFGIQAKEMLEDLEEAKAKEELTCEICGKVCKSRAGLVAHMRTHNN